MVQTSTIGKRQKTEEFTSCVESVLFNSDSLFKIASYLSPEGLLNLALTCRRFGIGDNDSLSLIDETGRRIVHDIATEEEMAALPCYDGYNWLYKYKYLQSFRVPLAFDQLAESIDYMVGNKSRVFNRQGSWGTAFSNNIMMAGKHYVSFQVCKGPGFLAGVMRPGEAMQSAKGDPLMPPFYKHFTQRKGSRQYNNRVNCCMYSSFSGRCLSSDWGEGTSDRSEWDGMEGLSSPCKVGMLLDFEEGTLSFYKNGGKLGVMKRGLAGQYCWVVAMSMGTQVSIKRGPVPAS